MEARPEVTIVQAHWDRVGLAAEIVEGLVASGVDLEAPTIEAFAPFDQFHGGGLAFTRRLARLGGLEVGMRVLDVGGGLGGPARTLAVEFGCDVTVVDLAASYVEAGRVLTELMGVEDRVRFVVGDALALPYESGGFDIVWTQNSGMNIADKERLYAGFHRVVRAGGRLVTQEPMAGAVQPEIYPTMWADDPTTSHLRTPDEMRAVIEAAGFTPLDWEVVALVRPAAGGAPSSNSVQALVMGADRLREIMRASYRNEDEGRTVMVHAVCEAR